MAVQIGSQSQDMRNLGTRLVNMRGTRWGAGNDAVHRVEHGEERKMTRSTGWNTVKSGIWRGPQDGTRWEAEHDAVHRVERGEKRNMTRSTGWNTVRSGTWRSLQGGTRWGAENDAVHRVEHGEKRNIKLSTGWNTVRTETWRGPQGGTLREAEHDAVHKVEHGQNRNMTGSTGWNTARSGTWPVCRVVHGEETTPFHNWCGMVCQVSHCGMMCQIPQAGMVFTRSIDFSINGLCTANRHYHNGPQHRTKLKYIDRLGDANRVNSTNFNVMTVKFWGKYHYPFRMFSYLVTRSRESRFRCYAGYKLYQRYMFQFIYI